MATEDKPIQNEQSKPLTEQGGQTIPEEQLKESAMPIKPIPQSLKSQSQSTSSTENESSVDSGNTGEQVSSSSDNNSNTDN